MIKKTKRIISALLVALLLITVLTGCGVNDLGYLKLSNEISNLAEYNFENELTIELSEELTGEDFKVDVKLNGTANLENLDSMYMDLDASIAINDIKIESPINFKIVDNKLYAPKTALAALLEVISIASEMDEYSDYDVQKKIIEELYNNDLEEVEYILLMDLGTVYSNDVTYKEISDVATNYMTKAFDGFDSKLIKKISNGYSIELNSDGILDFAENLLDYVYKNKEIVFDETIKYLERIYDVIDIAEVTEEDKTAFIEEIKAVRQDFYDSINVALFYIRSEEVKDTLDVIKGSKMKNDIYKEGKSYIQTSDIEIVINEIKMGKLMSNTKITPADVETIKLTGNIMDIEEVNELYNEVEDRINPVSKMELMWFAEDTEVQIYKTRLYENIDWDFQPYTIIDGRIYLPLRYICESFGEEVEWDGVSRKAYIVRGTEKIDMTGTIIDSKTMVKVRDFEKLGYKIGYEQVDGYSTATIEK